MAIYGDNSTITTHFGHFLVDGFFGCICQTFVLIHHLSSYVVGNYISYKKFSPTCGRNTTDFVFGISTSSNNWNITYTTKFFIGHSSSRSSCGQIPKLVKSNTTYGSKFLVNDEIIRF